ncbi:sporulation protein YjcZ [Aneurinibacillus tyrosinisolvens]
MALSLNVKGGKHMGFCRDEFEFSFILVLFILLVIIACACN